MILVSKLLTKSLAVLLLLWFLTSTVNASSGKKMHKVINRVHSNPQFHVSISEICDSNDNFVYLMFHSNTQSAASIESRKECFTTIKSKRPESFET